MRPITILITFMICISSPAIAGEDNAFDIRSKEIMSTLDDTQKEQLRRILSAHGLIQSTKYTMNHVQNGVTSCAKNNPDLSKHIKKSWKTFHGDIKPIVKKADRAFARTLKLENVLPRKDMKAYLALLDDEAKEKIDPVPVTEKSDCEGLMTLLDNPKIKTELTTILNESFGF